MIIKGLQIRTLESLARYQNIIFIVTIVLASGCSKQAAKVAPIAVPAVPTIPPPVSGQTPSSLGIFSHIILPSLPTTVSSRSKKQVHAPFMGDNYDSKLILKSASPSKAFLVFVYPTTTQGFMLQPNQFSLTLTGTNTPVAPSAYCLTYSNPNTNGFPSKVNNVFNFSSVMSGIGKGKLSRVAIAFEVSNSGGTGIFSVNGVNNNVKW